MRASVLKHKNAIRNLLFARTSCGDVVSELWFGIFTLAVRSEGKGVLRLSTRLYGDVFVFRCTCVLCAYVRVSTNMFQLRRSSMKTRIKRVTMVLLKRSACPSVCKQNDMAVRCLDPTCLLTEWKSFPTKCGPFTAKRQVAIPKGTI